MKLSYSIILISILFLGLGSIHFCEAKSSSTFRLAKKYFKKNQYKKAMPLYKRELRVNPRNGEARAAVAWMIFQTRAKDKTAVDRALKEAEKAAKYSPKNPLVYNVRGSIYFALNRFKDAQADFRKVIKLDPNRKCGGCGDASALLGIIEAKSKTK